MEGTMSDGINIDGAIEALSAELPEELPTGDEAGSGFEPVVEDNQFEAESFTGFDPGLLPDDMQQVYKSMQADYTRKTQEVAELRRQYESFSEAGVDPDVALQAVGFLQQLNDDPQFALEISEAIRQNVGVPDVAQTTEVTSPDVNNSYDGLPPSLTKELEEMRAFREEMVMMQAHQETMAELEAMENTIRTANPDYTDDDVEAIYSLAYATDGDLMAAQEQYHQIQQRLLSSYLKAKTVPHGATPAPSAPSTIPNRGFSSLDDAHKAAMEIVRNIS